MPKTEAIFIESSLQPSASRLVWGARILLIGYAVALTFKGTAALQSTLLLTAFAVLLWDRRRTLSDSWSEARWVLGPLLVFSIWVFLIAGFWREPPLRAWDPGSWTLNQPWFSLNQWRRDIGQPMVALLCGFWAFRDFTSKRWLFAAQAVLILVLAMKCLHQFHAGEMVVETGTRTILKGTLWVRGFSRDNIFFSYVLLLLLPGAFWMVAERKPGWQGWLRIGILLLLLYLIFLNKRRGTWLALYAELLLLAAWRGKRFFAVFAIGTLLTGLAAYHVRPLWFQREYDSNDIGRGKIYQNVAPLLLEHPVVGIGFGKDTVVKNHWHEMYLHAHNTFVNLIMEVGFPGLALWLGALAVYAGRFWKARTVGWSARIGLLLLIGFCVRNLSDDIWLASNAELFWFLMGVFMKNRGEA